jgi:ABC-2 type transport system ATP-binding protein
MDAVRSCIGVVFQDATLDGKLTARENLDFHAQLYNIGRNIGRNMRSKRIDDVLDLVDLRDKADVMVEKYSGGMQRRLAIARGLINHPQVLFLDEPTLGLDAQTRHHIWEYIKELNVHEGMTILLTTHYMEEADRLCERVAIIDKGRIMALDTPEHLKDAVGTDMITMQVQNDGEFLLKVLSNFPWVSSFEMLNGQLVLHVDDAPSRIPRVIIEAAKNNITINSVISEKPTLEDVFLKFTGRSMREGEAIGDPISKRRARR